MVLKGRLRILYADREEVLTAGQAYYLPPGHNVVVEEDCEVVEFSPMGEYDKDLADRRSQHAKARRREGLSSLDPDQREPPLKGHRFLAIDRNRSPDGTRHACRRASVKHAVSHRGSQHRDRAGCRNVDVRLLAVTAGR